MSSKDLGIGQSKRLPRRKKSVPAELVWLVSLLLIWGASGYAGSQFCCSSPFGASASQTLEAQDPKGFVALEQHFPDQDQLVKQIEKDKALIIKLEPKLPFAVFDPEFNSIKAKLTQALKQNPKLEVRFELADSEPEFKWVKQSKLKPRASSVSLNGGTFDLQQQQRLSDWYMQTKSNLGEAVLVLDTQQGSLAQVQKLVLVQAGFDSSQVVTGSIDADSAQLKVPATLVLFKRMNVL